MTQSLKSLASKVKDIGMYFLDCRAIILWECQFKHLALSGQAFGTFLLNILSLTIQNFYLGRTERDLVM